MNLEPKRDREIVVSGSRIWRLPSDCAAGPSSVPAPGDGVPLAAEKFLRVSSFLVASCFLREIAGFCGAWRKQDPIRS